MAASLVSLGFLASGRISLAQQKLYFPSADDVRPKSLPARPAPFLPTVQPVPFLPAVQPKKAVKPTFQTTGLQEKKEKEKEEKREYPIELEPPTFESITNLVVSEKKLQSRMRKQAKERDPKEEIIFPEEPTLSKEAYAGRFFPPMTEVVVPNYVCYGRLHFEDINSERYGWDLGFIQPFVSAGKFYWDVATFPYHVGTEPCRKYECSSGYCLPGDPVPYLLYPPQLSLTGALLEAGTIISLFAIFPG